MCAYKRISPMPVIEGGTGAGTFTSNGVLLGNTTSAVTATAAGTTGQILTGITGSAPTFQSPAASSISITGNTGGALTGNAFTFTGGTTGLSFGGSGTTETLTFAGITANGGTVNLATDATTSAINVGTGAGVKTTLLGSTNTTSTTTLQSGSGVLNVTSTNGALTINSGTGALGISTDASATTISIGTGGAVKGLTIGSTNTTSSTVVQAGTGASSFQPTGAGSIAIGSTNTGVSTFGNLTGTTTINFGGGSALTTFVDWTSWTPTFVGQTTAGTTTYSVQFGTYSRIGNIVTASFTIVLSAATGTGSVNIGGFPFNFNSATNYAPEGSVRGLGGFTWAGAGTSMTIEGVGGTNHCLILISGTGVTGGIQQMANAATSLIGTITYRV